MPEYLNNLNNCESRVAFSATGFFALRKIFLNFLMYLNPRFTQGGRDFGPKIRKHLTVPKNAQFCNLKTWGRGWGLPLRSAPLTLMQVLEFLTN